MLRSTSKARRLAVALGLLGVCNVFGQYGPQAGGAPGQSPGDKAVKTAGAPAEASTQPLDAQKSAPVQVLTREYDLKALTHEPKVPEAVYRGRILWVQRCAFCHDGLGQPTYKTMGPWLDQDIVKALTDDGTKAFINNGDARMPGFKWDLTPAQLDQVLAFLKSVPASAKPTPAQLAGRGEGASSD